MGGWGGGTLVWKGQPEPGFIRVPTQICILKFPVFSLSNRKFSLYQFTLFVTITYTKLTFFGQFLGNFCVKIKMDRVARRSSLGL